MGILLDLLLRIGKMVDVEKHEDEYNGARQNRAAAGEDHVELVKGRLASEWLKCI